MNHNKLTPHDVVEAIGGERMAMRIAEAMRAKSSVKELLQNFPTIRVALTKHYILHSTKGKDADGADCEDQLLLPSFFGGSTGVATVRIIWGHHSPRVMFFDDLGEAIIKYCIVVNGAPTASLSGSV